MSSSDTITKLPESDDLCDNITQMCIYKIVLCQGDTPPYIT